MKHLPCVRRVPKYLIGVLVLLQLPLTWGCTKEKASSPLDEFAEALEAQTPGYWEKEAFHREFTSSSGKTKATLDINRLEVIEQPGEKMPQVMLRNAVNFTILDPFGDRFLLSLAANEGLLLPNEDLRFRKGVLIKTNDGSQLEADSIEINRTEKRITSGPGFRLFTQVRLTEEDTTRQLAILEGDSIWAVYSFEQWEIKGVQASIPE